MIPDAYITHWSKQRLRIRIPAEKKNPSYFAILRESLSRLPGVQQVEVNPVTGSVLLHHVTELDEIADHAARQEMFLLQVPPLAPKQLSRRVALNFNALNDSVKRWTGGELDIPTLAFVTLLGLGGYQISRGRFQAPAWYTAFWYGMNIFLKGLPGARETSE